jgi:hypothetical protein
MIVGDQHPHRVVHAESSRSPRRLPALADANIAEVEEIVTPAVAQRGAGIASASLWTTMVNDAK